MRVLAFCLLFLLAGCATRGPVAGLGPYDLTRGDVEFAEALANYALGLISEQELGKQSAVARSHFEQTAQLDPLIVRPYPKIAICYLYSQQPDKALQALERACALNPRKVQCRLDLATACQITGHYDLAIENYRKAMALAPGSNFTIMALARSLFHEDKDAEGLKVIEAGMKGGGDREQLLTFAYNLGRDFVKSGNLQRSIPCFELVAGNAGTRQAQFRQLLGELYEGLGNEEDAVREYELAAQSPDPIPDSFVKLATFAARSDPGKAIKILTKGNTLIPGNASILFTLAYEQGAVGNVESAISILKEMEAAHAKKSDGTQLTAGFYLFYGAMCERAAHLDQAEAVMSRCLELYPDDHQALNFIAYMWAEQGKNLDAAFDHVTRALRQDPKNGAYIDTLGWVYYKQGKFEEALDNIKKACAITGEDSVVMDHLGDTFKAMNKMDEAIASWKESFMLDPENGSVAGKLKANGIDLDDLRRTVRKKEARPPLTEGK